MNMFVCFFIYCVNNNNNNYYYYHYYYYYYYYIYIYVANLGLELQMTALRKLYLDMALFVLPLGKKPRRRRIPDQGCV